MIEDSRNTTPERPEAADKRVLLGVALLFGGLLLSLALGAAFLLIYIGAYGFLLMTARHFRPSRRLFELFLRTDLSALDLPPQSLPLPRLALVLLRVAFIFAGLFILIRNGFLGQNLIWIYSHR